MNSECVTCIIASLGDTSNAQVNETLREFSKILPMWPSAQMHKLFLEASYYLCRIAIFRLANL